jgi:hypothetical protein
MCPHTPEERALAYVGASKRWSATAGMSFEEWVDAFDPGEERCPKCAPKPPRFVTYDPMTRAKREALAAIREAA